MSQARLRRLAAAEALAAVPPPLPAPLPLHPAADAEQLAREASATFRRMVERYRRDYDLPLDEVLRRVGEPLGEQEEEFLTRPPDEVGYYDLERIGQTDEALAVRIWERIKAEARRERDTGARAAQAVEGWTGKPWDRARFLVLRSSLMEAWRPRDGIEQQLVEQLAQWHHLTESWLEKMTGWTAMGTHAMDRARQEGETPKPVTLTTAEAMDQAAAMVERFHRLQQRTLRALQEYRQRRPQVIVRRAGQVNIAQQQVNVGKG